MVAAAVTLHCAQASFAGTPTVLIDDNTPGFYNQAIGETLNGTSPLFPNTGGGDPTFNPAPEPDLGPAASLLGNWLTQPQALNANWTGPQVVPNWWTVGTETAVVYAVHLSTDSDVLVSMGVDNGAFIWFDGAYQAGHVQPGGIALGELCASLGTVRAGTHYLQILREDHGQSVGSTILVTAASPCPGNIATAGSSRHAVDVDDLIAVILAWGPCPSPPQSCPPCPANIVDTGSSDDSVDVDDLISVILNWGPCPQ
jgi:hypothetical protein